MDISCRNLPAPPSDNAWRIVAGSRAQAGARAARRAITAKPSHSTSVAALMSKPQQHFLTLAQVLEAAKSETFRWSPSRKAVVVAAVRDGELSLADVEQRFGLSTEEFGSWSAKIDKHGVAALRATRLQIYEPHRLRARPARPSAAEDWDCAPARDWQARRALMRQRFG